MKIVVNLLKKTIKDTRVSFVGDRIPMDPNTIRSIRSRIRMDLLPYCKGGSMIPVDLSANCEGWIYDPNGSGIQILGIRSRDPYSGSTGMYGKVQTGQRLSPARRPLVPRPPAPCLPITSPTHIHSNPARSGTSPTQHRSEQRTPA